MSIINERQFAVQAHKRLSELLDAPYDATSIRFEERLGERVADAVVTVGPHTFVMECKRSAGLGTVVGAVNRIKAVAESSERPLIPLVAVPYMGESGREYCEQAGVAWLDLSGNAKIVAPGLYVHVIGHPNRFRRRGRPESAFSPRGSRIARWLLMNPGVAIRQRRLAAETGLSESYTSRVTRKLIDDGLAVRDVGGIVARDSDLLLDAWLDEYRFDRHTLIPGHIASMSGDRLSKSIAQTLDERREPYAMTGLAAAWRLTRYAGFRISTVYLEDAPSAELIAELNFRKGSRGANVWLVVPNDEGVFDGYRWAEGVRCVHPVQIYLDLKGHPERASEAADRIRSQFLSWGDYDD